MRLYYFLFIFLTMFLGIQRIEAQDSIKNLSFNLQLNHFIDKNHEQSMYFIPFNPGIEVLFKQYLTDKMTVATGINYTYSVWNYKFSPVSRFQRNAHELAFPILFERYPNKKIILTFGCYFGWLVSRKEMNLNKNSNDWIDITDDSNNGKISKFTCDLYFDLAFQFHKKPGTNKTVLVAPFVKYKLKDNWMNEVRTKMYFGVNVKFNISL